MATSADVPNVYDVVIDSSGYIFSNTVDQSLPFRVQRAAYGYTPTFVDRSNVSNQYGDNAQDFFLTIRQRDWSLGEQQKYLRGGQDGRYWMGSGVDVGTPGQVKLSQTATSISFAAAVSACARERFNDNTATVSSTKLYTVAPDGTITDQGVHGLGAAPSRWGLANDGAILYASTTTAGTVGVRQWNGAAFATFSATPADSLAFVNNTLYGFRSDTAALVQWDSAGTATTLFTWKSAVGSGAPINMARLHTFGGKVLIAFQYAQESSELWIYDGVGTYRLEVFPENFLINDIDVLYGVAYISGSFERKSGASYYGRPTVMFYDGSQIGKLWQANDYNSVAVTGTITGPHPALGVNDGRLIFTDDTTGNIMAYDPARGGVSSIGSFTANSGTNTDIASTGSMLLHTRNATTGYYFPSGSYPSSGYVISSLVDFDSSLSKLFRTIKVEFDAAADGNGGSVDIAYQVDSLTGAWTTLQAGAVSGTEYALSGVSGRAIAVKVTINKGTSTSGPTLKALAVRGAPVPTQYRRGEYLVDCTGRDGKTPVKLRNGQDSPIDGQSLADQLKASIINTTPFSITDRFGTFTGVCEPEKCEIIELRPEEYIIRVFVRQV